MRKYDEELLAALRDYIMDYQREHGSSPTYRKIMQNFPSGFTSTAKLRGYINVLCERRLIERERAGDGSIKVDRRFRTEAVNAPLVGQVACGEPIEAYENIEGSFVLPAELYGRGELMLLKADGESTGQFVTSAIEGEIKRRQRKKAKERLNTEIWFLPLSERVERSRHSIRRKMERSYCTPKTNITRTSL